MINDQNAYKRLENYEKSLEIFGKFKSSKKAARRLLEIGDVHKDLMNHVKARENYNVALKLYQDENNKFGEAITLKSIGNLWKVEKEYSKARKYYEQALLKIREIGNYELEKDVLKLISSCYQAEGALEDAIGIHTQINHLNLNSKQREENLLQIDALKYKVDNTWPIKNQSLALILYLLILIFAEMVTTYYSTDWGIILQVFLIISLIINSVLTKSPKFSYLLQAMILIPLIRIISLHISIIEIEPVYWLVIVSVILVVAIIILMQSQNISRKKIGLTTRNWPLQMVLGITGLFLGLIEYLIIQPAALIPSLNPFNIIFASSIVIISTGFLEEIIFRGMIQRTAENVMGKLWAIILTSVLFTVVSIGWNSIPDVLFIFLVSVFYGYVFQKTRSILGVGISHGICNVVLFLVLPFFW